MKEPKLGNIYNGTTLVGFRDYISKVFTPEAGFEDWELVTDNYCILPILCDFSLYSNGLVDYKEPFVEDTQQPEDEFYSLGDNEGILLQAGGNGIDFQGVDGVLLLVGDL